MLLDTTPARTNLAGDNVYIHCKRARRHLSGRYLATSTCTSNVIFALASLQKGETFQASWTHAYKRIKGACGTHSSSILTHTRYSISKKTKTASGSPPGALLGPLRGAAPRLRLVVWGMHHEPEAYFSAWTQPTPSLYL